MILWIGALLVLGASKIMGLVGIDNGGAQVQKANNSKGGNVLDGKVININLLMQ